MVEVRRRRTARSKGVLITGNPNTVIAARHLWRRPWPRPRDYGRSLRASVAGPGAPPGGLPFPIGMAYA